MRYAAAILGSALLLAACGQTPPTATTTGPAPVARTDDSADFAADYAKGPPSAWSYTAPLAAQSLTAAANGGTSSNTWSAVLSATNGWGPIEQNMSVGERNAGDGHPLTMGGKVYQTGLGLHANAELTYASSAPFASGLICTLEADVGVDAEVGARGSVAFQGWADGVKLYDTGVLRGGQAATHIKWVIPAARQLQLKVTDGGDDLYYDHADLANPTVSCTLAPTATTVTLAVSDVSVYHLHHTDVQAVFTGNYRGPVDLRLEDDAPSYIPGDKYSGIVLQTKQVTLNGGATTVPLTFAAPTLPQRDLNANPADLKNTYRLVASVNGRDVASTAVNIEEKLLDIRSRIEPAQVSGRYGDRVPVNVVVTFNPPLEGDYQTLEQAGLDTYGRDSCALVTLNTGQTFSPSETRVPATVTFTQIGPTAGLSCNVGGYLAIGGYVYKRYGYYSPASNVGVDVTYTN